MTDTLMDAAELCRARDLLGYTDGQLAADLGLSPGIVPGPRVVRRSRDMSHATCAGGRH
jgi:hypothetical protein